MKLSHALMQVAFYLAALPFVLVALFCHYVMGEDDSFILTWGTE